jgi:hypothetical protein
MATRWSTLSLTDANPPTGLQMGDLSSLLIYHFKDAPDSFERRRNHTIYGLAGASGPAIANPYRQENRNPYVDHPEYVWSVFVDQANDSQIAIGGAAIGGDGGSIQNVDLGRVFTGAAVPAAQNFTLNKVGLDGTYFEVATMGAATSSLSGRQNAFRTNQTDSKPITVGLNTSTSGAGLRSGTVSIDNVDITTAGGSDRGANDANDLFNISLTVLDHATPSFSGGMEVVTLMHDFGSVAQNSAMPTFNFDVFNFGEMPAFTADLDFDSVMSIGDASVLTTNLGDLAGVLSLDGGASQSLAAMMDTAAPGAFSATYSLSFSDEDLPGALEKSLTLTLVGEVLPALLAGDYNRDDVVDAADYTIWRNTLGTNVAAFDGADGDGDMFVDDDDYQVWKDHFGGTAGGGSAGAAVSQLAVPEPAGRQLAGIWLAGIAGLAFRRRLRPAFAIPPEVDSHVLFCRIAK